MARVRDTVEARGLTVTHWGLALDEWPATFLRNRPETADAHGARFWFGILRLVLRLHLGRTPIWDPVGR